MFEQYSFEAQIILESIYKQARLPEAYLETRVASLPYKEDQSKMFNWVKTYVDKIDERRQAGQGLYIFTRPSVENPLGTGTGKTTTACAIANEFIFKYAKDYDLEPLAMYAVTPSLLTLIKKTFNDEQTASDDEFLNNLTTVPLLILDDIGVEKPSDWVREQLYSIINERVNGKKVTIYTSNLPVSDLAEKLGERITSRIQGSCVPIELKGNDHRLNDFGGRVCW